MNIWLPSVVRADLDVWITRVTRINTKNNGEIIITACAFHSQPKTSRIIQLVSFSPSLAPVYPPGSSYIMAGKFDYLLGSVVPLPTYLLSSHRPGSTSPSSPKPAHGIRASLSAQTRSSRQSPWKTVSLRMRLFSCTALISAVYFHGTEDRPVPKKAPGGQRLGGPVSFKSDLLHSQSTSLTL